MKRMVQVACLVILLSLSNVSAAQGVAQRDAVYISGLSGHAQGYSLSCEARSAADLAAFWGISISETEFLEALPRSDNPDDGYVGDPNDAWGYIPPHSYGVHASPVADTLREYGLEAEAHRGLSWDDLRQEIDAGHPVIVWIIGQMWGGRAVEYEAPDGSTATVAAYEHTMILTGYNQETIQVVDAYSGLYQTYSLNTFLNSWSVLGNMAVFGNRAEAMIEAPPSEPHGDTYTVQVGDYLVALAERFGTTWQELAELSSINYPFTIYPGQVLHLPASEQPDQEPEEPPVASVAADFQLSLPIIQRNVAVEAATPAINYRVPARFSGR